MTQQCLDRDITIRPAGRFVSVSFNGRVIASSEKALSLEEGSYPEVLYIPIEDVEAAVLQPTNHHTTCQFKGVASYYDLTLGDARSANAVWYYADPCPQVEDIRGHVAFWGDDITYAS